MDEVRLRLIEEKDLPFVQEYISKKEVADPTNIPHPYPKDGAKEWYEFVIEEYKKGRHYPFAILCNGEFAGSISVRKDNDRTGALDYWVAIPFWNKGVGTTAAQKAIGFGVNELGLEKFDTCCLAKNIGSERILKNNGFKFVEEFEVGKGDKHEGKIAKLYRLIICNS
ncbi:GNAT family N-acetyltransferase [Halobacillus salinarum]|uniref:GNAT family N-acetyltransferase n=1 Tax=Halobacillus salinarum TaxID=2932257 RepID=A0ABY4EHZ5_9BACI|nr:GNAT family N-acetyltransferase [Halobacillus salinarum]UOQ43741.1 GNAT family N-acetyltransferase [Halobacillus salinarum]